MAFWVISGVLSGLAWVLGVDLFRILCGLHELLMIDDEHYMMKPPK